MTVGRLVKNLNESYSKFKNSLADDYKVFERLDKGLSYYNQFVMAAVVAEAFYSFYTSGNMHEFILDGLAGNGGRMISIANSTGLTEKLTDALVHFVNGKISAESSSELIVLAMVLDGFREATGYYLGATGQTKIGFGLNLTDLGVNHPINFLANGARLALQNFGLYPKEHPEYTRNNSMTVATASHRPKT